MSILVLDSLFNVSGMHAVFITLVHSLWIGAVMALLAGTIVSLTKKHSPQLRYQLLTSLLGVFVLCMLLVFYTAFTREIHTVAGIGTTVPSAAASSIPQSPPIQSQHKNVFDVFISFIQANAGIIVSIWFMIIIFKCLQLMSGLNSLQQMKKRWISEPGDQWNQKLYELAAMVGIRKPVLFLQSSLAKVPMVIGHLKPVLLFPMGMINSLPQDEVEAILLHELAHIKRNDFLINLLQQFAEILFFFNPAVLWISALIKSERENCCDDMALSVSKDKKIFIHALVAFQEYRAMSNYVIAFPGSKNHLLNRVKRIITNDNKTLNNMEKLVLASGIIITCLATVAFNPGKEKNTNKLPKINAASAKVNSLETTNAQRNESDLAVKHFNYADTLPKNKKASSNSYNYKGDIDGKRVEIKEENDKVTELYVDGKKIPEEQYAQYQPLIEKMHKQMKEQEAKLKLQTDKLNVEKEQMEKQAETMNGNAEKMKEQSEIAEADMERQKALMEQKQVEMKRQAELMHQDDTLTEIQSQKMHQDLKQRELKLQQKQAELQKKEVELQLRQEKLELELKDSTQSTSTIYAKSVIAVRPKVTVHSAIATTSTINAEPIVATHTAVTVYAKPAKIAMTTKYVVHEEPVLLPGSKSISEDIISDLTNANIISSNHNLSFTLTNDALIVNGVKQPEDVHQKILQKYQGNPGDKISLSYSSQE